MERKKVGAKAQAALEYLIVLGIAIGLLLPTLYIFSKSTTRNTYETSAHLIAEAGDEILKNAEGIYAMGEPSWITLEILLPDTFETAYVINRSELVFTFKARGGESDIVFYSDIPFGVNASVTNPSMGIETLPLHSGRNKIRLYVSNFTVFIKQVTG